MTAGPLRLATRSRRLRLWAPASTLISVDLPAPFRPSRQCTFPTRRGRPRRAPTPGKLHNAPHPSSGSTGPQTSATLPTRRPRVSEVGSSTPPSGSSAPPRTAASADTSTSVGAPSWPIVRARNSRYLGRVSRARGPRSSPPALLPGLEDADQRRGPDAQPRADLLGPASVARLPRLGSGRTPSRSRPPASRRGSRTSSQVREAVPAAPAARRTRVSQQPRRPQPHRAPLDLHGHPPPLAAVPPPVDHETGADTDIAGQQHQVGDPTAAGVALRERRQVGLVVRLDGHRGSVSAVRTRSTIGTPRHPRLVR